MTIHKPGSPGIRLRRRLADLRELVPVHAPLALVLLIVAIAFLRLLTEHWREGTLLLGGSLLTAAVLRAALPRGRVGVLAVRGTAVDVLCYVGLGVMVIALAATITRG